MDPVTGGMLAMGGLSTIANIFTNQKNLDYQKEQLDYMKGVQQQTWQREDNAVQRRVADLQAAGLSPVLAAGSAASTSAPIKVDPMRTEDPTGIEHGVAAATAAMGIAQSASNLKTQEAQRSLLDAQETNMNAKTAILAREFKLYDSAGGHPKYQDVWGKRINSLIEGMSKVPKAKIPNTPEGKRKVLDANRPSGIPNLTEQQLQYIYENF